MKNCVGIVVAVLAKVNFGCSNAPKTQIICNPKFPILECKDMGDAPIYLDLQLYNIP